MVSSKQSASFGESKFFKSRGSGRNYFRNQGFILLYALWVLTGISVYIAIVVKQAHNINPPGDNQLTRQISERQLLNILQYVLMGTYSSTVKVDPRLVEYRKTVQSSSSTDPSKQENIKFLKELLSQMGMELNLEEDSGTSGGGENEIEIQQENIERNAVFYPRKKTFELVVLDKKYTINIFPINAQPNLNLMDREARRRYLAYLGLSKIEARQLSDVISDWIDEDDFSLRYGAELNYYLKLPVPYKPRNAYITEWGELYYLKNMDIEKIKLLRENFVLQGNHKRLAAQYITPEELAVLANVSLETSRKFFEFHQAKGNKTVSLDNLIGAPAQEAIESIATWHATENDFLKVIVHSDSITVEAVFNKKEKKLYSWRIH